MRAPGRAPPWTRASADADEVPDGADAAGAYHLRLEHDALALENPVDAIRPAQIPLEAEPADRVDDFASNDDAHDGRAAEAAPVRGDRPHDIPPPRAGARGPILP